MVQRPRSARDGARGARNDIAGSIRIPAAHCGLVGLKPARGRVRTGPEADPPVGLFVEGVVTRSVRDTAGLLDAIAAPSSGGYWPAALPGPLVDEVGRALGGCGSRCTRGAQRR